MKKVICILLILSIMLSVFAEDVIFREKKQNKGKESLYVKGYMDGAKSVKIKKDCMFFISFFLSGNLFQIQENIDLRLCKKTDIEYIEGFKRGYNDKARILRREKQAPLACIFYGAMSILFIILYYRAWSLTKQSPYEDPYN